MNKVVIFSLSPEVLVVEQDTVKKRRYYTGTFVFLKVQEFHTVEVHYVHTRSQKIHRFSTCLFVWFFFE